MNDTISLVLQQFSFNHDSSEPERTNLAASGSVGAPGASQYRDPLTCGDAGCLT